MQFIYLLNINQVGTARILMKHLQVKRSSTLQKEDSTTKNAKGFVLSFSFFFNVRFRYDPISGLHIRLMGFQSLIRSVF